MTARRNKGFTLVELLVVIVIISLLAALLLPALAKALCNGRQGATSDMIRSLGEAAKMYESDQNAYPPGNGTGSSQLATSLKSFGPRKLSYFEFTTEMIDPASGNIWSKVRPYMDWIYYKNNQVNWPGNSSDPSAHYKQSFDMWCSDCSGNSSGCNSWE